jgi:hypothetical protein
LYYYTNAYGGIYVPLDIEKDLLRFKVHKFHKIMKCAYLKNFFAFSFFENNTTILLHPINLLTFSFFTWMLVGLTKYFVTTNASLNSMDFLSLEFLIKESNVNTNNFSLPSMLVQIL